MSERKPKIDKDSTEDERVQSCIDALDAMERIHGTRALALGIKEFEDDEDYRQRFLAATPEFRERVEGYARLIAEHLGETFTPLSVPTAEPLPPVGLNCPKRDRQGRTCIQSLANGWIGQSDLCPACTVRFMAALDATGEELDWHPAYTERGTA